MKGIAILLISYANYHKDLTDKYVLLNRYLISKYESIKKRDSLIYGLRFLYYDVKVWIIEKRINSLTNG